MFSLAPESAGKRQAGALPCRRTPWRVCDQVDPTQGHVLVDVPKEQAGKPGLRNRDPGSTVEKLPERAVKPEQGTTQCKNTEFDIRWKCSKVYRVAALVASES